LPIYLTYNEENASTALKLIKMNGLNHSDLGRDHVTINLSMETLIR